MTKRELIDMLAPVDDDMDVLVQNPELNGIECQWWNIRLVDYTEECQPCPTTGEKTPGVVLYLGEWAGQ
tara:strand:+ start:1168 stop:1374 length:207 start_codon:yes stop_codon:yes gene_type:complete